MFVHQSMLKRRDFLGRMALGALGVSLPTWNLPAANLLLILRNPLRLETVILDNFLPYLNGVFRLRTDTGGSIELRLTEAVPLGAGGERPAHLNMRAPFSLVYLAPPETNLPQRIYRLEHEALGALELFLVPIGSDHEGLRLEAVFS